VTFFTEKPLKYPALRIACAWNRISLNAPTESDWDDSHRSVHFQSSPSRSLSRTNSRAIEPDDAVPGKLATAFPEPAFHTIGVRPRDLILRVAAVADVIRYVIDTVDIQFSPTMMYQSRIFEVRVTNTCQIRFNYEWQVQSFTTVHALTRSPFSVEPHSGVIAEGQTTVFKFRFAPEEVDDYATIYKFAVPFLQTMEPTMVSVFGLSRRPLCHIDAEMSDYISAGRRHPAYTDPLPEDVKVIELFSSGIGAKTQKKFDLINPTAYPYEVTWKRLDRSDDRIMQCLVPHALVSSGKRYRLGFQYTPVSVKTVESLWLLSIAAHDVNIHFLIVGRIRPS
jgi:hydrocephalus-inducing protein